MAALVAPPRAPFILIKTIAVSVFLWLCTGSMIGVAGWVVVPAGATIKRKCGVWGVGGGHRVVRHTVVPSETPTTRTRQSMELQIPRAETLHHTTLYGKPFLLVSLSGTAL